MTIQEVIKNLKKIQNKLGDVEVFTMNSTGNIIDTIAVNGIKAKCGRIVKPSFPYIHDSEILCALIAPSGTVDKL